MKGSNMNVFLRTILSAIAVSIAFGTAMAQTPAVKEDKAQMKADEAGMKREKAQLKADQKTMKADTKEGKMAAESKESD